MRRRCNRRAAAAAWGYHNVILLAKLADSAHLVAEMLCCSLTRTIGHLKSCHAHDHLTMR